VDWIEKDKVPVWVIVTSPHFEPQAMADLLKSKGIERTLGAYDPNNPNGVGKKTTMWTELLKPDGTLQTVSTAETYGKGKPLPFLKGLTGGTHAIPVEGLTEAGVIAAWWKANRGLVPGGLKELAGAAKRKNAIGEQAQLVITAATSALDTGLAAAGEGFAAYEKLEGLSRRFDGLDLKALKSRLSDLGKDPGIKKELKARSVYMECKRLLGSTKPKEQAAGRDGMAALAKAMPETVYGVLAGSN
jgi:hypothetical protein